MARNDPRRPRPPLDSRSLRDLALHYAARFATTRARLAAYLARKLKERGWAGGAPPDLQALADEFAASGYVDDEAFARSRAESMGRRGYGARRIAVALHQAGIEEDMRAETLQSAEEGALAAAIILARRRRFGPFGDAASDSAARRKQIAAMIRAGHGFDVARRIVDAPNEDSLHENP
ncbi:regulatory protein RecX [Sphingomonas gilva]|nr:RecX family transcriptional regulator [Sphingomonas gilva]